MGLFAYEKSKGYDQPAHLYSPISVNVIHTYNMWNLWTVQAIMAP